MGMKSRLSPVLLGLSMASCAPGACSPDEHTQPSVELTVLEPHEIPPVPVEAPDAETTIPVSRATADDLDALLAVVERYYPRWDPERETLDDYFERYEHSSEQARLRGVVWLARKQPHWPTFLRELRQLLGEDHLVQSAIPPSLSIPSYQVVTSAADPTRPHRYRYIVYRMSHLAPVYDYYESTIGSRERQLGWSLHASPEVKELTARIESKIAEHFPGYQRIDPQLGKTPLPHHGVDMTIPASAETSHDLDEATLAHALFDATRNWADDSQ